MGFANQVRDIRPRLASLLVRVSYGRPMTRSADGQRIRRTLFVWGILALAFFAVAGYLTYLISEVNGTLPFVERERSIFDKRPFQALGIYAQAPDTDFARRTSALYISYRNLEFARVSIVLPPQSHVRILINNLVNSTGCTSSRSADEVVEEMVDPTKIHHVTIQSTGENYIETPLYVVTPESSTEQYRVLCNVSRIDESETFVTRRASFEYYARWPGPPDYSPIAGLVINLAGVADLEDVRFDGGFQEPDFAGYETQRVLTPDSSFTAHWRDLRAEQTRDILLVLIGVAIALGATMLIEGLRPAIDAFLTVEKNLT
jgi:hypothetical protein